MLARSHVRLYWAIYIRAMQVKLYPRGGCHEHCTETSDFGWSIKTALLFKELDPQERFERTGIVTKHESEEEHRLR